MQQTDKTVAEFFAGMGLMRAGLDRSGWTTVIANDIDPVKQRLYLHHFQDPGDHFLLEDIHQLSGKDIPTVALATASFPCTDLSLAGRRAGLQGQHSSAFWGFVHILKSMGKRKPPLILLENVAGFLTSNNGQDFKDALTALNQQGYAVDAFIINAAHFVPQSRVRLFIVGIQAGKSKARVKTTIEETELRPAKLVSFMQQHIEINWSVNTTLPQLPPVKNNLSRIIDNIPTSSSLWWSQERVTYLLDQTSERHLIKIAALKAQNKYTYLTAFRRVRNGKSMAEIRFDGIAGCLRTPKGGSARQILLKVGKGEVAIRLLTPRECARLMGAGDFALSGSDSDALFGFGDAVCVPVISWIADHYLNPAIELIRQAQSSKRALKLV